MAENRVSAQFGPKVRKSTQQTAQSPVMLVNVSVKNVMCHM